MDPTQPISPAGHPPDRGHVLTEQRAGDAPRLDTMETQEILVTISAADQEVAPRVRAELDRIGAFIDLVHPRLARGGRLIYLGAGTSGRLGVLDASECPPTFQTDPGMVVGLIAGGDGALRKSSEHKEDEPGGAHDELDALGVGPDDAVLGIAAGGTTPYVLGGVEHAKSRGAATGLLVCSVMDRPAWCDVLIAIRTGPEVVTGSTRMKAGSATKMVLNMISTASMIRMQKTYGDLMVDMRATNDKLRDRAARIVSAIVGVDRDAAFALLDAADGYAKVAAAMGVLGINADEARQRIDAAAGSLRAVIGDLP
ncbi:MAG: N-acetylmuramic acid 6-phosphate etherase [Phycisphaerales bacterium]|nr:N-acetylmuramic acid 6-phosphate etherase [Planctomycetota bacterium]MCH8509594.1 N-acetylmuramic acid 6-phosphate etherase [Phycisphaerales bacterium]